MSAPPTNKQNLPQQPTATERAYEGRGRVKVTEIWWSNPLPRLTQGAAYIGSGDGWKNFTVLADFEQRTMIVTLPDKRCMRVPFENVTCYVC